MPRKNDHYSEEEIEHSDADDPAADHDHPCVSLHLLPPSSSAAPVRTPFAAHLGR